MLISNVALLRASQQEIFSWNSISLLKCWESAKYFIAKSILKLYKEELLFFCKEFLDWNSSSASSSSTMLVVIQNLILSQCWAVFKITWKFLKIKLFSFITFLKFTTNYDLAHATRHGMAKHHRCWWWRWKRGKIRAFFIYLSLAKIFWLNFQVSCDIWRERE